MSLVEQLREVGLRMGTIYPPHEDLPDDEGRVTTTRRYRSWTTDEAKATAASDLGATVISYRSRDPEYNGWEINVVEVVS